MQPSSVMLLAFLLCLGPGSFASEFRVKFEKTTPDIRYSQFYGEYELSMKLKIIENGRLKIDHTRLVTGLTVKGTNSLNFNVSVTTRVSSIGTSGRLVFVCRKLLICMQIRSKIIFNPSLVQKSIEFAPYGLQDGLPVQFGTVRSTEQPLSALGEVVFQQRFDNTLSFAQTRETYVKGFGNTQNNYWMGLEQLSMMTKDRKCKLFFAAMLFNNTVFRATYYDFQVRGADENYKLRIGDMMPGSQLYSMKYHDNMEFSTFDSDSDRNVHSCSMNSKYYVGWWYNSCCYHNPNGQVSDTDVGIDCYNFCCGSIDATTPNCLRGSRMSFVCS